MSSYTSSNSDVRKASASTADARHAFDRIALKLRAIQAGADHYEILEVERDASDYLVKASYRELAKQFHPDRHTSLIAFDPSVKWQTERVFAALVNAHATLSNPRARVKYDESLGACVAPRPAPPRPAPQQAVPSGPATFTPEQWLALGVGYATAEDHERAVHALQRGVAMAPTDAGLHAALGRSLARLKGHHKAAEKALRRAVELAVNPTDELVELARLYRQFGRDSEAERLLRRALALDPSHREARVALGVPKAAEPQEQGGLLSRLFGRKAS